MNRWPTLYLPHGGGPWPFLRLSDFFSAEEKSARERMRSALADHLVSVGQRAPRALLVISAHWEATVPTVMTSARPPMLFDYYGFPPETYQITWPAPGAPELAARVRALLETNGVASAEDSARGFDHGTFVPLALAFPRADVPAIQLSLVSGLDPKLHLAIGRALAPLRSEGVLLVGSGMSYHNMADFRTRATPERRAARAKPFDDWLAEIVTADPIARDAALERWESAPAARVAHPREEHLMPLMVAAGAAGEDRGRAIFRGTFAGIPITSVCFGESYIPTS